MAGHRVRGLRQQRPESGCRISPRSKNLIIFKIDVSTGNLLFYQSVFQKLVFFISIIIQKPENPSLCAVSMITIEYNAETAFCQDCQYKGKYNRKR